MNTIKAQDWAQLNRFKKANALLSISEKDVNRVVFMGNSITEGWLQDSLSLFKNKSYKKMGNPPKRVVLSKLIRRYFKRQGGIEAS